MPRDRTYPSTGKQLADLCFGLARHARDDLGCAHIEERPLHLLWVQQHIDDVSMVSAIQADKNNNA